MRTALYDHHIALGAKMVPFAGWDMPLQYTGVLDEHRVVRNGVGIFDVSHMGRIKINGSDAEKLLDFLSTNQIRGKRPGSATYTVWCQEDGGCVDDTIIYKIDGTHFFMIANASNRDKDLAHLANYAHSHYLDVEIEEVFSQSGIVALQGPSAQPLLSTLAPEINALKPMQFLSIQDERSQMTPLYIARCGYTGSGGYELYGSAACIIDWWEKLFEKGKAWGIKPIGLGARDSLRLEVGFALYGHELCETIYPNESVASWTIKWDKGHFLGKEALIKVEEGLLKRHAYGISFLEGGIPRQGYQVLKGGAVIGEVTSGGFSPALNKGIALILVRAELQPHEKVMVQIRQTLYPAEVVDLPFVRKTG